MGHHEEVTASVRKAFAWECVPSLTHTEIAGMPQTRNVLVKDGGGSHQKCQHHKRKKPQKCFKFTEAKSDEYKVKGKGRKKMF